MELLTQVGTQLVEQLTVSHVELALMELITIGHLLLLVCRT